MLVFLLGGLITTWKEFEYLLRVLAASCVVNLAVMHLYAQNVNGRTTLPFGTLANSNDYAAHLLMLVPAVLWMALTAKSFKLRILTLGVVGYTVFVVLSSASRGALISVALGTLYFLASASTKQRVWALGLGVIMALAVFSVLPRETIQRMLTFSQSSTASEEALMSSEERFLVLQDAVYYAFRHPFFGVGPDNFRVVEGRTKPLLYAPAHNSYVAAACECGFPGFILFMGGVLTSFLTFWRIKRKFQGDRRAKPVAQAALCMQLMMVMFCIAVAFLNFTYAFHFPLMVGISIAMAYAAENWESRSHPELSKPQTLESHDPNRDNFRKTRKSHDRVLR
jgi:O-antigen ligase